MLCVQDDLSAFTETLSGQNLLGVALSAKGKTAADVTTPIKSVNESLTKLRNTEDLKVPDGAAAMPRTLESIIGDGLLLILSKRPFEPASIEPVNEGRKGLFPLKTGDL